MSFSPHFVQLFPPDETSSVAAHNGTTLIAVSTALTLVVIPVLYAAWLAKKDRRSW